MTTILLKKTKFILLVNLIARNYKIFSFQVIIKNQRHKGILSFEAFFESTTIDWKDIYPLYVKPLLTLNIAHFNTKF